LARCEAVLAAFDNGGQLLPVRSDDDDGLDETFEDDDKGDEV